MPAGASDPRLRLLSAPTPPVPRPRLLHGIWAGLQVFGPGADLCGLFCWASLLRHGVSQGGAAATAQDELEDPRDLCHVFFPHLRVCEG